MRTGRRVATLPRIEQKFNPYHDPRNGQFTFAPEGAGPTEAFVRSGGGGRVTFGGSSAGAVPPPKPAAPQSGAVVGAVRKPPSGGGRPAPIRPAPPAASPKAPPPEVIRPGCGHNGGPPLKDNLPLRALFPALAAGEAVVAIASAGILANPIGPAAALLESMNRNETARLIREIRKIDPDYRFQSLGGPLTPQGQVNEHRQLRWDLAARALRMRGDHSHLQAETVRFVQERVDDSYAEAKLKYDRGELPTRLSRQEAIGTYVDRQVRGELRQQYRATGIPTQRGDTVRVNGRAYDTSGTDGTYRIPDVRIGRIAIDMTLTAKSLNTPQVRGFFNSDFLPEAVIIIRPSQLGSGHSYAIPRPKQ